ncbi:MAG: hypothetical protein WC436_03600 [Candidatus Babeliales bacterium]
MTKVILLNGASSSGKSSIVKELQNILGELFLEMGVDRFMSMIPSNYQGFGPNASQMWTWEKSSDELGELVKLKLGPDGKKYVQCMYKCIKTMAENGFNVIVDDVCLDTEELRNIAKELDNFKVYFIGIKCRLEILEQRERLKKNRIINSARGQYDIVHQYNYDFEIDTSDLTSKDCALKIKEYIYKNSEPKAFKFYNL